MSSPGTVGRDEQLRLFLGLRLATADAAALAEWQERELGPAVAARHVRLVPRESLHVTLAFLGSRPRRDLDGVVAALRDSVDAVPAAGEIELAVERYRETRAVAMLVLGDRGGRATALALDVQGRLEALGMFRAASRAWLPHVTVLRYRERPRLAPPLPERGTLVPSDAAAFVSRLHPSGARYEVLESVSLRGPRRHPDRHRID